MKQSEGGLLRREFKMSSILLINPPIREFARPNNAPLGLLYIASYLEEHGHSVDICDLNVMRQLTNNVEDALRSYSGKTYDFIGLSGLVSTYQWQRRILDIVRNFNAPILLGGGMATFAPDFVTRNYPEIDIIVLDEGEKTMLEIANEVPLKDIDGIWYWDEVWFHNPKTTLIADLDSLPFPNYDKVPVREVYLGNAIWGRSTGNSSGINYDMKRSLNMVMSRGCKYNCSFCAHAFKVPGCRFRMRSPDNVLAEIDELVDKYSIDFVGFVDDNTCSDYDWMVEFCIKLIERPYKLHWGCSARVDEVNEELLMVMREANCEWIGFGMEAVDPEILRRMCKGNVLEYREQAEAAIRLTREAGIWCNCTFIVGYPGENLDTIRETAIFMAENDVPNNIFYATPYPATKLYNDVKDKIIASFSSEDAYIKSLGDATEFRVNCTDALSDEELIHARKCAIAGKPDFIYSVGVPIDNAVYLDPLISRNLMQVTQVGVSMTPTDF